MKNIHFMLDCHCYSKSRITVCSDSEESYVLIAEVDVETNENLNIITLDRKFLPQLLRVLSFIDADEFIIN